MTPSDPPVRHARRPPRRARLTRTLIVVAALGVVAAAAVYGVKSFHHDHLVADSCQVVGQTTGATYTMDPEQLLNASTIADLAMRRGLPQHAVIIALATAQQESKLRNLDSGDRDSVGLFQQRPSQGWGATEQLLDPIYAGGKFYDALLKVPSWQTIPVAAAAQAVQRSAFPDAYASWQQRATALAAALTGSTLGQLTCRLAHPGVNLQAGSPSSASADSPSTTPTASSATSTAPSARPIDRAVATLTAGLAGDLQVTSPAVATVSAKSRTITISGLAPAGNGADNAAEHRTGTVSAWAMAHASTGVTQVVVGDQEWRPDRDGWQRARAAAGPDEVVITVATK
jgi:hypothetical protein